MLRSKDDDDVNIKDNLFPSLYKHVVWMHCAQDLSWSAIPWKLHSRCVSNLIVLYCEGCDSSSRVQLRYMSLDGKII